MTIVLKIPDVPFSADALIRPYVTIRNESEPELVFQETGEAANDGLAKIKFTGLNSAGTDYEFVRIRPIVSVNTDGSEQAALAFLAARGGSLTTAMIVSPNGPDFYAQGTRIVAVEADGEEYQVGGPYPADNGTQDSGKTGARWQSVWTAQINGVDISDAQLGYLGAATAYGGSLLAMADADALRSSLNIEDAEGVPAGGSTGDVLSKATGTDFDTEWTDLSSVYQPLDSVLTATTASFTTDDETKLDGIEASADVTDTANVTAAGALMDSELADEAAVKGINQGLATTDSPTFNVLSATSFDGDFNPSASATHDLGGSGSERWNTIRAVGLNLTGNAAIGGDLVIDGSQVVTSRQAAINKINTSASSGTLPTADGTMTFADAAAPTNVELLEGYRELEAKLETIIDRLGASAGHGLTAD